MSGMMAELLYQFWLRVEKVIAWWLEWRKGGAVVIHESWVYRREAAEGSLGTKLKYKRPSRLLRGIELLAWYSALGQLVVWRTKKGDW